MLKPRDRYADAVEAEMAAGWSWRVAKDHVKRAMEAGSYNSLWGVVERLCKISFTRGREDAKEDQAALIRHLKRENEALSSGGSLIAASALTKETRLRKRAEAALAKLAQAAENRDNVMGDPIRLLQCKAELESAAVEARAVLAS